MNILTVDDDPVTRLAMKGMVRSLGHTCTLAASGSEAWKILQDEAFDVVVTDRMMPDMDGLELCRLIRSRGRDAPYLYVIFSSGYADEERVRDGMDAGADDYLAKPLRQPQLINRLISAERVIGLHRRLEQQHRTMTRSNEELLSANAFQSDVIAMLGHDARQPLTSVLGCSEMLLDEADSTGNETLRRLSRQITRAGHNLGRLLEDVLTMAALESGGITSNPAELDVDALITDVILDLAVETSVRIDTEPELTVWADRWQIRQIIANLISNARKYGREPYLLKTTAPTPDLVEIEVSDCGEGVPESFVPHLFERFTRADSGIATARPGTGFGLYIVAELARANAGTITYVPAQPTGAGFRLTLPRHQPSPQETDA